MTGVVPRTIARKSEVPKQREQETFIADPVSRFKGDSPSKTGRVEVSLLGVELANPQAFPASSRSHALVSSPSRRRHFACGACDTLFFEHRASPCANSRVFLPLSRS